MLGRSSTSALDTFVQDLDAQAPTGRGHIDDHIRLCDYLAGEPIPFLNFCTGQVYVIKRDGRVEHRSEI